MNSMIRSEFPRQSYEIILSFYTSPYPYYFPKGCAVYPLNEALRTTTWQSEDLEFWMVGLNTVG
jgi:hypothetical protein